MKIFHELKKIDDLAFPRVLTIGMFDGVHLGHQHLLSILRKIAGPKGSVFVITFKNHPRQFFFSNQSFSFIQPLADRLKQLENLGVDVVFLLSFTKEFANLSYEKFLNFLKHQLNFTHLVLGENASFGKDQKGKEKQVVALSKKLGFEAKYIKKITTKKLLISTSNIKKALKKGNLTFVKKALGLR